jgi:hypothetical protein
MRTWRRRPTVGWRRIVEVAAGIVAGNLAQREAHTGLRIHTDAFRACH